MAGGQVRSITYGGWRLTFHARVTCLAIEGNEAWIGSRVTLHRLNGQDVPDDRSMVFRVQDGGQPSNTADYATLVFFSPAADYDMDYCATRPAVPPLLRNSDNGNNYTRLVGTVEGSGTVTDPRAVTRFSPLRRARSVLSTSVMPSAK
jgi:hypothetical protein